MSLIEENVGGEAGNNTNTITKTSNPAPENLGTFRGIMGILEKGMKTSVMTEAGEKHLEDVKNLLAKSGTQVTIDRYPEKNYEIVLVSNPTTKLGVVLLYSELSSSDAVASFDNVKHVLKTSKPDISIVQPIIVYPIDYPKAMVLARRIQFLIGFDRNTTRFTVDDLTHTDPSKTQKLVFVVTNNLNNVRKLISELSPHTVAPRTDYGIGVYLVNKFEFDMMDKNRIDYNQLTPVLAVGAYNKFIQHPHDPGKFIPVSTISEIATNLPDPGMFILGLQLAIDRFVVGGDWITPHLPKRVYTSAEEARKGDHINLGGLTVNADGTPHVFMSEDEVYSFVQEHLVDVFCAFDCVIGRSMVPGMERFLYSNNNDVKASAKQYISNFLNNHNIVLPDIVQYTIDAFSGYLEYSKLKHEDYIDSRNVDFLNSVQDGLHPSSLIPFLQISPPTRFVREFMDKQHIFHELFIQKTCILNPEAHNIIRNEIASKITVHLDVTNKETLNLNMEAIEAFRMSANSTSYGSTANSFGSRERGGHVITPIWD